MSLNAETLKQARQALENSDRERQQLVAQIRAQGKKIGDLEQEVQRQANLLAYTQQLLADTRREAEALRAQLPDASTLAAYEELCRYLACPESQRKAVRPAA